MKYRLRLLNHAYFSMKDSVNFLIIVDTFTNLNQFRKIIVKYEDRLRNKMVFLNMMLYRII